MNIAASKNAVAATRKLLKTAPASYSLPLGQIETGDSDQLLTLAALLVVWVQSRERCSPDAAVRLLARDYVFDAILSTAAERERVQS